MIAMMLLGSLSFAQEIFIGAGVLEQRRVLGTALATNIGVNYTFVDNFSIKGMYTYGFLEYGNFTLIQANGPTLKMAERGEQFQQLAVSLGYAIKTSDDVFIRPNIGGARQVSGPIYLAYGADIVAFYDSKLQVMLSWLPVVRPDVGSSHTVTINLVYKLWN